MAATVASYTDVMKEVWTSDRLEKQFYDDNPLLDKFERSNRYTIGKQAQVPIHKGRSGGYSVKSSAGGTLNTADEQKVDQALYTLSYNYQQISIETGTLNQANGGAHSVGDALDLEVTGGIADMRKQVMRQAVSNGDALIAQCTTTSNSTTILLLASGYGYDAIVRGWLYPGLLVDIGTTADEVLRVDAATLASSVSIGEILTVVESSTAPAFTLNTAATTASTDFVSVKDARSGTTSNEMNGLRTIAGSTTSGIGGLDPDTAGEGFWKPAHVDTATTTLSLDLLLSLQLKIAQKTGGKPKLLATSLQQEANFYSLLQNQVRFGSDSVSAGNVDSAKWNGMDVMGIPDIPDRELYMLTPEDFIICTGRYSKPTWMSDIEGGGGRLRWSQGATNFVDAVTYPLQLGIKRRNSHAAAIGLTA